MCHTLVDVHRSICERVRVSSYISSAFRKHRAVYSTIDQLHGVTQISTIPRLFISSRHITPPPPNLYSSLSVSVHNVHDIVLHLNQSHISIIPFLSLPTCVILLRRSTYSAGSSPAPWSCKTLQFDQEKFNYTKYIAQNCRWIVIGRSVDIIRCGVA